MIGVYIRPESMTVEQYRAADEKLRAGRRVRRGHADAHMFQ